MKVRRQLQEQQQETSIAVRKIPPTLNHIHQAYQMPLKKYINVLYAEREEY